MSKIQFRDRIRLDAPSIVTRADGSMLIPARFSRAGVYLYHDADGNPRRVLRHPDDVLSPEALSDIAGITVTLLHPDEMVTPSNYAQYGVGTVGTDVHRDGDHSAGTMIIHREDAQRAVAGGIEEISLGYWASVTDEAGTWDGEPYDARQRNQQHNHAALVPVGRAGPGARLLLDTAGNALQPWAQQLDGHCPRSATMTEPGIQTTDGENGWVEVVVDGESVKVRKTPADLIVRIAKERDAYRDTATKATDRADAAEGKIAALEAKVTALDAAKPDLDKMRDSIREEVKGRVTLERECADLGIEVTDDKTDADLRREAVKDMDPTINRVDAMNDAAIGGVYQYLIAQRNAAKAANANLAGVLADVAKDAAKPAEKSPATLDLEDAVASSNASK